MKHKRRFIFRRARATRRRARVDARARDRERPIVRVVGAAPVDATRDGGDAGVDARAMRKNSASSGVDGARRALRAQLLDRSRALRERELDAERALGAARRAREDAGVELFALQDALARARAEWLTRDARTRRARDAREASETETLDIEDAARAAERDATEATVLTESAREALEIMALAARDDGDEARAMESAVKVTERAASVVSEAVDDAERARIERETRVRCVRECVDRARATATENAESAARARRDAASIRTQIDDCDDAISNVHASVDVAREKWKSVLKRIGAEDATLERIRKDASELAESSRVAEAERDVARESIARAHGTQREHIEELERLDKENENADSLVVSLRAAVADKKARRDATQATARKHDDISRGEEKRAHEIEIEIEKVDKAYVGHTHELHDVEERALLHVVDKMTTNKLANKLTQATRDSRARARAAANESTVLKHKVAQTKVEIMRIKNEEYLTGERLRGEELRIEERRDAIDVCEGEIARNVEEIERLTMSVDVANKKLEKLRDASPEHVGPLEAQIAHLRNEIKTNEQNCAKVREIWLQAQKAMLFYGERSRVYVENLGRLGYESSVLSKKKDRHDRNTRRFVAACESISKNIERQRRKLSAIDEKIALTTREAREEAIKTLKLEEVRFDEIDELSGEISKLRAEIRSSEETMRGAREDSDTLNLDITQLDRRIALEQRAQIMLDPTRGNHEVTTARKENAKLAALLQRLDSHRIQIASKIESCVKRRELIVAKGDVFQAKLKAKGDNLREAETLAAAKRAQSDVRRRLADAHKATSEFTLKVTKLESEHADARRAHDDIAKMMSELSERRDFLRVKTTTQLRDKYERALLETSGHQKLARALQEPCEKEDTNDDAGDRERYERLIDKLEQRRDNMLASIRDEINLHPHLAQSLRRAKSYLSVS